MYLFGHYSKAIFSDLIHLISFNPLFAEKHGNRDYLLCINYATLDDDAEYTIVARNIIGEARSSAQLVVDEGGSDGMSAGNMEYVCIFVDLQSASSQKIMGRSKLHIFQSSSAA